MERTETVNYYGTRFTVTYQIYGEYCPATHWQPAEYPEMEVFSITVEDSDICLMDYLKEDVKQAVIKLVEDQL